MKDERSILEHFEYVEYGEANISAIYRTNFRLFEYYNSDEQFVRPNELKIVNGLIQNKGQISSGVFDKYHIEENDFKAAELELLNTVEVEQLNYGQKRKYKFYKEYVEFKIIYPEWYHIKNRNGFFALKRYQLDKYKDGIYSFYFKDVYNWKNEDGTPNEFYYSKRISDWKKQRDELLGENQILHPRLKLLLIYNSLLAGIMGKTVQLFSVVDKYDGSALDAITSFNIKKSEVLESLDVIGNYSQNINHNINTGHYKIALEIQHYCILMFNEIITVLDDSFFIKIAKTPLNEEFKRILNQLENAIDLRRLDFLLRLGAVAVEAQGIDPDSSIIYDNSVFKKLEGELIFKKFKQVYTGETKALGTIYSFLFYSLLNDSLIIDSHSAYKDYCKKSGININNIMPRYNPLNAISYTEHKTLKLTDNYIKIKHENIKEAFK